MSSVGSGGDHVLDAGPDLFHRLQLTVVRRGCGLCDFHSSWLYRRWTRWHRQRKLGILLDIRLLVGFLWNDNTALLQPCLDVLRLGPILEILQVAFAPGLTVVLWT